MKTTPKDFFMHLAATIFLYVAVGTLINLAFSEINYLLPDALANYWSRSSIAWPISILVILVPVLYVIEWLIARDVIRMPEKKELWIRRWRIYLTLFLGALLIIGDLIALINTYLNGEITARFIYKCLAILLIAGAASKYYFFTMYENWKHAKLFRRANAWFGLILVIVVIVAGFVITGSPAKQRALRFDGQRMGSLQNIQYEIINYWQRTGKMPASLADLNDAVSNYSVPADPETKAPFEYTNDTSANAAQPAFSICGTFSLPSEDTQGRGDYSDGSYPVITYPSQYPGSASDSWAHPAGRYCFSRVIDPSRYPRLQQKGM